MKKIKTKFKIGYIILAIVLLLLIACAVTAIALLNHKPDNGRDDPVVFDTAGLVFEPVDPPEGTPVETTDGETNAPSSTDKPTTPENKNEMFNFLILGKDKVAMNTDVIMLLNYNISSKKFSIMQIPRDTYVTINNYYGYKLNSVYGYYYNEAVAKNEKKPEEYGMEKLRTLLEQNLCIKIHYHALVNLDGFRNIVDILGGVEVDIPADMYYVDNDQGLRINLKKGKQVLDGEKAEMFVRYRAGYLQADIGRMDAQKIFMSALIRTVKDNFNLTTVVKMVNEVFKNIETDVSLSDMVYFAKNLLEMDMENMAFMSITGYAPTPPEGYAWYFVINRKGTLDLINKHFNIYDFKITDAIFDKNRIFTSTYAAAYLNPYYIADPEYVIGGDVQSADDINNGSIEIPRVW